MDVRGTSPTLPGVTSPRFHYVGPAAIRASCEGNPAGRVIENAESLRAWLANLQREDRDADGWATYTIGTDGLLRLAHRRTEHVACAGAGEVLAAGEVQFDPSGEVVWLSNNSTGFCPDLSSFEAVSATFSAAGLSPPPAFDHAVVFRRCRACGERSVIKDDDFRCGVCEAPVSRVWNFDLALG